MHIRIEALLLMECRSLTFKRSLPESSSRCMAFCIIPDLCRKVPHRALIVQSVMDTLSTRCMHSSHAKMDPRTSLPRIACSLRFRPTFCDEDEADLNDAAGDLLLLLLLLLLARASSSSSCSCSRSGGSFPSLWWTSCISASSENLPIKKCSWSAPMTCRNAALSRSRSAASSAAQSTSTRDHDRSR